MLFLVENNGTDIVRIPWYRMKSNVLIKDVFMVIALLCDVTCCGCEHKCGMVCGKENDFLENLPFPVEEIVNAKKRFWHIETAVAE